MDKYQQSRKGVAVGIILLFISVAVAPSINFTVVKASNDNDLVEVTTQACGINGFENTTVKLTKQQYQNLNLYLIDFRARLNQTTTREDAVLLFKEAVVELNKYGLLPKGMSVNQAQLLTTGGDQNLTRTSQWHKISTKIQKYSENISTLFCLISGQTTKTFFQTPSTLAIFISYIPLQLIATISFIFFMRGIFSILSLVLITLLIPIGSIMARCLDFLFVKQPVLLGANMWLANSNGWIETIGVNGKTKIEGTIYGKIPGRGIFYSMSKAWVFAYTDPSEPSLAARGFIGLRVLVNKDSSESFYLGSAVQVKIS
jgi:hypothetical protein